MSETKTAAVSGVLLLDKPEKITSHDAVNMIRRLYSTKQVGHTGTLDPMATGLLCVLVGRAVKASEYVTAGKKKYIASIRLGIVTDTDDITGKTLSEAPVNVTPEELFAALRGFVGKTSQLPPAYSAIKIGGKRLLDYARAGKAVEVAPREIEIYGIKPLGTDENGDYSFEVECSKGTYIRALCRDIGALLGCGAAMSALRRVENAGFSLENAYTLERLGSMSEEEKASALLPAETLFSSAPKIILADFYARLAHSGCEIYQKKIGTDLAEGTEARLCDKNGFFALARAENFPQGSALKPLKQFDIL